MLTALLYGVLASSGLLIGVAIGLVTSPPRRLVAAVVAFGSGVLVSALTFELMEEAFTEGSPAFTIGGFLLGAVIYVAADVLLERMAARSPRSEGRDPQDVVVGALGYTLLSGLSPTLTRRCWRWTPAASWRCWPTR